MTFDLTENERRAALVLVRSCLDNMGGKRPSDLQYDEFTWVEVSDLTSEGWSKEAAAGTLGSLMEKGLVFEADNDRSRPTLALTTSGWQYLDTIWVDKLT